MQKPVDSENNKLEGAPPVLPRPQSPSSVGSKSSKPGDIPVSGVSAGILMILATPASFVIWSDPANTSNSQIMISFLLAALGLAGAGLSFARNRYRAVVCIRIFVGVTGLFTLPSLFSLLDDFPSSPSRLLNRLLFSSLFGFLLGLWALWNLRKAKPAA